MDLIIDFYDRVAGIIHRHVHRCLVVNRVPGVIRSSNHQNPFENRRQTGSTEFVYIAPATR